MGSLSVFNFITLDGYYKDIREGISWHRHDEQERGFSANNLAAGNTLLFGRVTYEMMASFWPTAEAERQMPDVAAGMNRADKIVFSTTLDTAGWVNTLLVRDDMIGTVQRLKASGRQMTILGSGKITAQLAAAGLIDRYDIMIDPVAIGQGSSIFKGIPAALNLRLNEVKPFNSGSVLLSYLA